jgi:hypothetical protein
MPRKKNTKNRALRLEVNGVLPEAADRMQKARIARVAKKTLGGRPKGRTRPPLREKDLLKAIRGSCGVIKRIAEKALCHPSSVRAWIDGNDAVAAAWKEEIESRVDEAENAVMHWINDRDDGRNSSATARWYLERRHKDYTPRKELQVDGVLEHFGTARIVEVDIEQLTLETRVQILDALKPSEPPTSEPRKIRISRKS